MASTVVQVNPRASTSGEHYRRQLQRKDFKVPAPTFRRHAAPSAPWPWMDFDTDASDVRQEPPDDSQWDQYPWNLFRNWTEEQVERSHMLTTCSKCEVSTVHKIGVFNNGKFEQRVEMRTVHNDDTDGLQGYWEDLGKSPPSNMRVQALFVEHMSVPLLQMLGTKYEVEPFFFASSVNWIPSRYSEDPKELGDHITVVLPFIRILKIPQPPITRTTPLRIPTMISNESSIMDIKLPYTDVGEEQIIDTQAALPLPENKCLVQDLLSLHMVRKTTTSTIISYHPSLQDTSANRLQALVRRTGDSVYWSKIFEGSRDPTFLFLATLWYALYSWDEAFEVLFHYIRTLEVKVLKSDDIKLTRELHRLQAHLLSHERLLRDFLQSVKFIKDTPNPAMNHSSISDADREGSAKSLCVEADTLMSEIERLDRQRKMMSERLDNAIRLTFATVNIKDSKSMQGLAEITVKDSAAMKQIAYLTMVFLPGTYIANVFSMNVRELFGPEVNPPPKETVAHYIVAVVSLTLFTSWLAIALRSDNTIHPDGSGVLHRALWPFFYAYRVISNVDDGQPSTDRHPESNAPPDVERPLDTVRSDGLPA